jgi:hypothetical protein
MSDTLSERRLRRRLESSSEEPPTSPDVPSAAPGADVSPPAEPPASLAGGDWRPLDAYAWSGVAVEVRGDAGQAAEAFHISSRRYVAKAMKWEPINIWRVRNASGTFLNWTPVEYRPLQMVVYQPPVIDL